jgi:hypothetical protein
MTPNQFRRVALSMPEAVEGMHMRHLDFRVSKKVFATLGYPDAQSGMVKLTPEQQKALMAAMPGVFSPAKGAWGKRGSTIVNLDAIDLRSARQVICMAWQNMAGRM